MRSLTKWSALVLTLAAGGGTIAAQTPGDSSDGAADPPKSKATASVEARLSVEDMQTQLGAMSARIKAEARHVMHVREQARKQKDVIKLTCVNDKLVQLKAQQNIFGAVEVQLQASLADAHGDRFDLFTQATTGAESIRKLREEADACLGEFDLSPSESAVDVVTPEIIDDPTKGDNLFDYNVEPPAYASPFR